MKWIHERVLGGQEIKSATYRFTWLSPEFDRRGPYVSYSKLKGVCHIHWDDGALFRYIEYAELFNAKGLSMALRGLFYGNIDLIGKKAALFTGGVNGCFVYCPRPLAETVFHIVYAFTLDALRPIAKHIRPDMLFDDVKAEMEKIRLQRRDRDGYLQSL